MDKKHFSKRYKMYYTQALHGTGMILINFWLSFFFNFYHFIIALFIILLFIVVFIYLFWLFLLLYIVRWPWVSRKVPINKMYYAYFLFSADLQTTGVNTDSMC